MTIVRRFNSQAVDIAKLLPTKIITASTYTFQAGDQNFTSNFLAPSRLL